MQCIDLAWKEARGPAAYPGHPEPACQPTPPGQPTNQPTPCAEVGTGDIEVALSEYSRRWLPSALAVVELTEEGFGGNRRAFTLNLKLVQVS